MKTVYNIPRHDAKDTNRVFDASKYAWISIQEPLTRDGNIKPHITNEYLDKLPNLKVSFWDIEESQPGIVPASPEVLDELFAFIMTHRDSNIVVNCAAGKSRSGAIAKFCVEKLGHIWDIKSQQRADPNLYIYSELIKRFEN